MASVIFGGGVTNIVGSHAGNTFARNKGGSYVKKKTHGTNPRSSNQMVYRTRLGQLSKDYSFNLSDADRAAWRTFAATNPTINRLGNTTFLSGQQAYTRFNAVLLNAQQATVSTPPVSTAISSVNDITLTAHATPTGPMTLYVDVPGATGDENVLVWLSPPMNPGRAFISSQLRRIGTYFSANSFVNVTSDYKFWFGALPTAPGQKIFMRAQVVNITNGVTSAFLGKSTLWVV